MKMKIIGYSFQGKSEKEIEILSKYIQEKVFGLGGSWASGKKDFMSRAIGYIFFNITSKSLTSEMGELSGFTSKEVKAGTTVIYDTFDGFLTTLERVTTSPFKVGEWVTCLEDGLNDTAHKKCEKEYIKEGTIFQVKEIDLDSNNSYVVAITERRAVARIGQYPKSFRLATEEEAQTRGFRVGDWIVVIESGGGTNPKDIGLVSRIVKTDVECGFPDYTIEIKDDKIGNNDKFLAPGCIRLATPEEIEKAKEKRKAPQFKIGDWIIVKDDASISTDGRKYKGRVFKIGNIFDSYSDRDSYISGYIHQYIDLEKATEGGIYLSEIKEASTGEIRNHLFNEAKARGFVDGVTLAKTGINSIFSFLFNPIKTGNFIYNREKDSLDSCQGYIYVNGKWAEIQPTINKSIIPGIFVTCRKNTALRKETGIGYFDGRVMLVKDIAYTTDKVVFPVPAYSEEPSGVYIEHTVPSTNEEIESYIRSLIGKRGLKVGDKFFSAIDEHLYPFDDSNYTITVKNENILSVVIKFYSTGKSYYIVYNGKLSQTFLEPPAKAKYFLGHTIEVTPETISVGCKRFTKDEAKTILKFIDELGIFSIESEEAQIGKHEMDELKEIINANT
jgi:hypothetical protein